MNKIVIIILLTFLVVYIVTCLIYRKQDHFLNLPFEVRLSEKIGSDGLFAVRDIKKGEIIESCPLITDNNKNFKGKTNDYIFKYDKNNSSLVLGYCSMINHSDNPNLEYYFENDNLIMKAVRDIKKDEELYNTYGSKWWKSRSIDKK